METSLCLLLFFGRSDEVSGFINIIIDTCGISRNRIIFNYWFYSFLDMAMEQLKNLLKGGNGI